VYSCQAINSLGVISREFNLLVLGPPSVIASRSEPIKSVIAGTSIELPCAIQAVPPPKITWLVNGHDLVAENRQMIVANHSLL
jgi:hemicentin